jgi:hypothetical protein
LGALDVLKDHYPYCNIFHNETLTVLAGCKAGSEKIYRNLIKWNDGKLARRGDLTHFLVTAGLAQAHAFPEEKERKKEKSGLWGRLFGSGQGKVADAPPPSTSTSLRRQQSQQSHSAAAATTPVLFAAGKGRRQAVAPSPFFNHGEANLVGGPGQRGQGEVTPGAPTAINKALFSDGAEGAGAEEYLSFSEFIARQKALSSSPPHSAPASHTQALGQGLPPRPETAGSVVTVTNGFSSLPRGQHTSTSPAAGTGIAGGNSPSSKEDQLSLPMVLPLGRAGSGAEEKSLSIGNESSGESPRGLLMGL